jgi:oxygen-independent coproporphyrinogen-3 oxidase
VLNEADLPLEFLMNGLRLNSGVSSQSFVQRTGLPLSSIDDALLQAREKGLLEEESTRLNATLRGRQYLNSLLELFL